MERKNRSRHAACDSSDLMCVPLQSVADCTMYHRSQAAFRRRLLANTERQQNSSSCSSLYNECPVSMTCFVSFPCTSCAPQRRAGVSYFKPNESHGARQKSQRDFWSQSDCPGRIKDSSGTPATPPILLYTARFLRFLPDGHGRCGVRKACRGTEPPHPMRADAPSIDQNKIPFHARFLVHRVRKGFRRRKRTAATKELSHAGLCPDPLKNLRFLRISLCCRAVGRDFFRRSGGRGFSPD